MSLLVPTGLINNHMDPAVGVPAKGEESEREKEAAPDLPHSSSSTPDRNVTRALPEVEELDVRALLEKELGRKFPVIGRINLLGTLLRKPETAVSNRVADIDVYAIVAALILTVALPETFVDPSSCVSFEEAKDLCNKIQVSGSFTIISCITEIGLCAWLRGLLSSLGTDEAVLFLLNWPWVSENLPCLMLFFILFGFVWTLSGRLSLLSIQYQAWVSAPTSLPPYLWVHVFVCVIMQQSESEGSAEGLAGESVVSGLF
uniref:Uncharacterized protein n=1 Tax=Chromera velia CCMP2878 TaxID=1169474 RepID=A0A0G4ICF9_9ALVE|eukprot:Cvel_13021.t1-p1 / transcript=Cvel_13021.t1 / gene=Cvel_13021 / organism=Chromera_velia_CCMP2878 / gene_product=hypothetical protein / transcript_product=hypothetical protein / location=Cvel_scaffold874:24837-25610(+) / protein_length=258 / sequence_SO=supercontig / SO=protein_coding / is_pseudo=false